MATYQSITNGSEGVWPTEKHTTAGGGGCEKATLTYPGGTAGAVPFSTTRDYTPLSISVTKWDPTRSSRRNWAAIKKSGVISMTPYSKRSVKDELFVVSRDYEQAAWRRKTGACRASTPYVCLFDSGAEKYVTRWTQNDHIGSLSPSMPHYSAKLSDSKYEEQISDAISSSQQEAFASAMSTYDLLSELGEAKETLSYLSGKFKGGAELLREFAHSDEPTHKVARFMKPKTLLHSADKALRRYGARWMEFRYAIMPLIYAFKDVNEMLIRRNSVYKTSRSWTVVQDQLEGEGIGDVYVYEKIQLQAVVRSTVKVGYDRGALQRVFSQTAFNPFKTGWELLPYSFVVDWFANVGDVITSATSVDFSSQKACSTSVKRTEVSELYLRDSSSDTFNRTFIHNACGNISVSHTHSRDVNGLLQRRTVESYDRTLFSRPEPKLVFDPYLNWKRFTDAMVLSHKPITNLLRSLKYGTQDPKDRKHRRSVRGPSGPGTYGPIQANRTSEELEWRADIESRN